MTPKVEYVPVNFFDVNNPNNKPDTYSVPKGTVIKGMNVEYTVLPNGKILKQLNNGQKEIVDNVELIKPQLAALRVFANIDGDASDIRQEELATGGGFGISCDVKKELEKAGSVFVLADSLEGANSGEGAFASADFVKAKNEKIRSCISIDMTDSTIQESYKKYNWFFRIFNWAQ